MVGASALAALILPTAASGAAASKASPAVLLLQADSDALAKGWVHEVAAFTQAGDTGTMRDDVGLSNGHQVIDDKGVHAQVIVIGNNAYIEGNAKAVTTFFQLPVSGTKWAGKWISFTSTDSGYATVSDAVTLKSNLAQIELSGPYTLGRTTTVGGVKAIPIHGRVPGPGKQTLPATLYVSAAGPVLPLQLHAGSGRTTESLTWTKWGKPVTVTAPPNPTPIGKV